MHKRAVAFAEQAREEYGFDPDVHEFQAGTKTAADAADAIGCDIAQIASSLVFVVDGSLVISVTSGANRVSEAALGEAVGASPDTVSMADADEIKQTIGWAIGGVPPFCHDEAVPVLVDETLCKFETVWAAAGTPNAVFPIDPETLCTHADATVATVAA